jgi:hypothetical protein
MCKVYLVFIKLKRPKDRKTDIWEVITMQKDHLGYIKFDGAWRQYVHEPGIGTKWSASCNDQISAFLKEQNEKWRKKIRKRKA